MYALQTVSLSIKPETFCDATRTRYEGNQLYYGSSYSSGDGKSIPSAFLMKTHRYRYGLCDLIANWKCKCKRVLFLSSLWLQNNIRQFIFYTCFNFFWLHVYLIFQKIFFINLYIHMKKKTSFRIDLLSNPTSGLLGMHYLILFPYRFRLFYSWLVLINILWFSSWYYSLKKYFSFLN